MCEPVSQWTIVHLEISHCVSSSQRMHHIGTGKQKKSKVYGFCKIEIDWKSKTIGFCSLIGCHTGLDSYLPWLGIASQSLYAWLNQNWKGAKLIKKKLKKKQQCLIRWSNLSLSPGSLWCTSSTAGNTGTPSLTGWSCRQSCHPRSSCLFPDPSPCPEGAVPGWTRAWPGEEVAGGAWLCWEDPMGFGLGSSWGLLSVPAASFTYNLLQKQGDTSIHVLLLLDCSVLWNICWLTKGLVPHCMAPPHLHPRQRPYPYVPIVPESAPLSQDQKEERSRSSP